jgi:nucleotide-binding universal stress UspA family protein
MTGADGSTTRGRIVVGVDGSESSLAALSWAAQQALMTGSAIEAITTWEWPTDYGWSPPYPADFDPAELSRNFLEEIVAKVRDGNAELDIRISVVEGHPAPVLIQASVGADLLVVGCRGHGEFAGMLIGSVSEHCATHARCPVLVHRDGR